MKLLFFLAEIVCHEGRKLKAQSPPWRVHHVARHQASKPGLGQGSKLKGRKAKSLRSNSCFELSALSFELLRPVGRNLLLGLTLIVFAVTGCGNGSESEPPQQPAVLRKRIAIAKKQTPQAVKLKERATKAEPPLPEKKPMMQQEGTTPEPVRQEVGKKLTYSYDPKGKPDPFRPIFAPEHEGMAPDKKKGKKKKRLPLTPLQRIDLGQLKLVGIIVSPIGNKALVEEPSGKGYVITKGTYVGRDFGRVKRILNDRVVVEEEVEDFLSGEMKPQTRELRLQKRPGHV